MNEDTHNLANDREDEVFKIVESIDRDVERGEDIVMGGLCVAMMSTFFAPVAPPEVLLPLVGLTFAISSGLARLNYGKIQRKLKNALIVIEGQEKSKLKPLVAVFEAVPYEPFSRSLNPITNLKRTMKSAIGGLLINPFWMVIFYMMGIQIDEEKKLIALNKAVMQIEQASSSVENVFEFYA